MKLILFTVAMSLSVASAALAAEYPSLVCEGDTSVVVNPTLQTVHVADRNQKLNKVSVDSFEKLRGGPHTYRISGTVVIDNNSYNVSINTTWRPENITMFLSISGAGESLKVPLLCQEQTLPEIP